MPILIRRPLLQHRQTRTLEHWSLKATMYQLVFLVLRVTLLRLEPQTAEQRLDELPTIQFQQLESAQVLQVLITLEPEILIIPPKKNHN